MLKLTIRQSKNPSTKVVRYFPGVDHVSPVDVDRLCADIEHSTSLSEADVKAVINAMQYHIVRYLQQGNSVRLGDLGSFRPTVSAASVTDPKDVKVELVKNVRVRFTPSGRIARELDRKNVRMTLGEATATPPAPIG